MDSDFQKENTLIQLFRFIQWSVGKKEKVLDFHKGIQSALSVPKNIFDNYSRDKWSPGFHNFGSVVEKSDKNVHTILSRRIH